MQKTFLSVSVAAVAVITLLSVRIQLSQASAESLDDSAFSSSNATTVALEQTLASSTPASTAETQGATTAPSEHKAAAAPVAHSVAQSASPQKQSSPRTLGTAEQYPDRLIIPSIGVNVPIVAVGVNSKGEMAVPPGNSDEVGWYNGGPMPGSVGTAVLDAHVFAAFKSLRNLAVGGDIYVQTKGGSKLHFKVRDSRIYELSELTSNMLFGSTGDRRLNLITCAGTYVPSIGTYDHRLVDYAVFVAEE